MRSMDGSICSGVVAGREVHFFVVNKQDEIQRYHAAGTFYEAEELEIIAKYFPRGGVFADCGAHVGNHTIFVGMYLHPAQVIVVEPNPAAIPILQVNIALNGLMRVTDLTWLGTGLSDARSFADAVIHPNNLGRTSLLPTSHPGGIRLVPGDEIFSQRRVDFIKLDVEGMEIAALSGLAATIARWRPSMFIEVDDNHAAAFQGWLAKAGYVTAMRCRRYPLNENYMVLPMERG